MYLLYPSNPLRLRQPDEQFAAEVDAIRVAGFEISVFSMEDFQVGQFRSFPTLPGESEVLYRGWMMSASEYQAFVSTLAQSGVRAFTSPENYLASHHLPN